MSTPINISITKKLSDFVKKTLAVLKEDTDNVNKTYIPVVVEDVANYKVPVTEFGKGGSSDILRIFDTVAKNNSGLQYLGMSLGDDVLAKVNEQDLKDLNAKDFKEHDNELDIKTYTYVPGFSEKLDLSTISEIDWLTWYTMSLNTYYIVDKSGPTIKPWYVLNPYTNLKIDTSTMKIGKVYVIRIHAGKNQDRHDYNYDNTDPAAVEYPSFIKNSVTIIRNDALTLGYVDENDNYSSIDGTFIIKPSVLDLPSVDDYSSINPMITIVKASEMPEFPTQEARRAAGIKESDIAIYVKKGSENLTYAVFSSNIPNSPKVTTKPTDASNVSFVATVDGKLFCKFTAPAQSGGNKEYRLCIPTSNEIRDINFYIKYDIPEHTWSKWYYEQEEGQSNATFTFKHTAKDGIKITADGPKFFWPYLLVNSPTSDGATTLYPRFHPVNLDTLDSSYSSSSSFTPDEPRYEATVYMCRIDDEHVLILGY